MYKPIALDASKLCAIFPPERIPWESSAEITRSARLKTPQPRAMQALELAMHIDDHAYNVYLSGETNLGRTYTLNDFLGPRARRLPTPPDLVYVYNFPKPDSPRLLSLPAGQGGRFKSAVSKLVERIRKDLPSRFERDTYTRRRSSLHSDFQLKRDQLYKRMDKVAVDQGFNLDLDESGSMTLYPLVEGKRLSEQEFEQLDTRKRNDLKLKGDSLVQAMAGLLRRLSRMEQDFQDDERNLEREVGGQALSALIAPVAEKFKALNDDKAIAAYFEELKNDVLDNLDIFLQPLPGEGEALPPAPHAPGSGLGPGHDNLGFESIAHRYEVNLFVDNSATHGAPVVHDDHPVPANLLGCIEREAEMGALVTNFTLIKAGSLHKANGGFLLLHIEDIIQHPLAWEGLLRALRSRFSRIEDASDGEGVKTKGLQPEPIPLKLKVILIGGEEIYEALLLNDDRFGKLFKLKAHMTAHMARDSHGVKLYLQHVRRIIEEAGLLHFKREAMAGLVDFGSRLIEDQKKLSLEFPLLREIMVEASAGAKMRGKEIVDAEDLRLALRAREFRSNLVEEAFMEEYDRGVIKVLTSGQAIGRVNGLSVTAYGDFEFGLPHQISCTVGVGHGGVIDLERDAQLGGPIHTKGMMILKSYLIALFAQNKPLVLTGSLYFEQSYAGIEGDSASGAELAALLSAIAQVPISLSLAFTGAVSQSGQIMAVGGVTRKVEGFFEVCRRHGLSGEQGVILPKDNIDQLMLKDEILDAVRKGKFHIYPVEHISQALELLTSLPSGNQRKNGGFTPGSLYDRVDKRLHDLGRIAKAKSSK